MGHERHVKAGFNHLLSQKLEAWHATRIPVRLLSFLDREVSRALAIAMENNGIVFRSKDGVRSYTPSAEERIELALESAGKLTSI